MYKLKELIHETRHGIFLICFTVGLLYLVSHINGFLNGVGNILSLLKPLFIGFCIAYVLNILMTQIEDLIHNQLDDVKFVDDNRRIIAIILTVLFAILVIFILFMVVVPQLIDSLLVLVSNLGDYMKNIINYIVVLVDNLGVNNEYVTTELNELKNLPWNDIFGNLITWVGEQSQSFGNLAENIMNSTMEIAGHIGVFLTSFMISLYLLMNKESYSFQFKQVLRAFVGTDMTLVLCEFGGKVNEIFRNFIGGQLLEATILFGMYAVSMTLFRMPYAILISALIAITSIIPYFGAMIGSFVGVVLIFAINPLQAVWFFIYFQILQQIENNLIYPKVVGNSVGLPAIWVVIGILAFGSLFGIVGMIIAVPTCAVLYQAFRTMIFALLKYREIDPLNDDEDFI